MVGQERRADPAPETVPGGPGAGAGWPAGSGQEAAGRTVGPGPARTVAGPAVRSGRAGSGRAPAVRDLRRRTGRSPHALVFAAGDVVVLSGLPGSGKSTLLRRAAGAYGIDSQDTRDRWERRLPRLLPYWSYRPLVRAAHYGRLWRALRSGAGVVVHDCGTHFWVRALLARTARRRGSALHLLLLDVTPAMALAGQAERGRKVSAYAFARHRGAVAGLVRAAERARLPAGCRSAVLLDREAAAVLRAIRFGAAD
ncbi:AAA family ATPase [Streptomyces sp. NPDC059398]|uniref:AAA family ATPase n=1 Tax=Streptomyces sp. NPDC059398 TaxID=3346820 RepID=UPI0036CFC025